MFIRGLVLLLTMLLVTVSFAEMADADHACVGSDYTMEASGHDHHHAETQHEKSESKSTSHNCCHSHTCFITILPTANSFHSPALMIASDITWTNISLAPKSHWSKIYRPPIF